MIKAYRVTVSHLVVISNAEGVDPEDLDSVALSAAIDSWGGNHLGEGVFESEEFVLGSTVGIEVDARGEQSPVFRVEDITEGFGTPMIKIVVGLNAAPGEDDDFPQFDNRDGDTTQIWVDTESYVEVNRAAAQYLIESFDQ
jgi:hypothetical protein